MRIVMGGWTFLLATALAIPTFAGMSAAEAKGTKSAKSETAAAGTADTSTMSKEDQDKLREHNKLRAEIKKVRYPAAKADVVAKVKGIKADDKKWFEQTLPEKTYNSADEVFSARGWETTPAEGTKAAPPAPEGAKNPMK